MAVEIKNAARNWQNFMRSPYDWGLLCGLIGIAPLLSIHAQNLAIRKHFQFFPLAWLLFVVVIFLRSSPAPVKSTLRKVVGHAAIIMAVMAVGYAVVLFSPWFSHVALIFLCLGWMFLRLGKSPWYQPAAWITLILITLPLPMNGDTLLIQRLQSWSTRSASNMLDLTATPHLAMGNVLKIRTGELFVDEACSGVDSLYSLAAVALMLVIWQQRGFVASLLTLATVPLWAWLGNLFRIFAIALLLDRFGIDLTHGWPHELLGLSIFAVSFGCLMLTQHSLTLLLSPFPVRTITSNAWHSNFNRTVSWPGDDPASTRRRSNPSVKGADSSLTTSNELLSPKTRNSYLAICACFVIIGTGSAVSVFRTGSNLSIENLPSISTELVKQEFTKEKLPERIQTMKQMAFETTHRETGSIFGAHSATWQYNDDQTFVQISIDFPFATFHGLEQCYLVSGYTLIEPVKTIQPLATEGAGQNALTISEVRLADEFNVESYLCYANFYRDGSAVTPYISAFNRGAVADRSRRIAYQIQLFARESNQLNDAQRQKYHQMLIDCIQLLLPTIQKIDHE